MDVNLGLDQDLINAVAAITEASCSAKKMEKEELHPNQKVLDKNKNGKLDADDFKKLRKEEAELDEDLRADINSRRRASINSINQNHPKTTGQKILSKLTGGRVDANTKTDSETGKKYHDVTLVKNKDGKSSRPVGKSLNVGKSQFNLRVKEEFEDVYLEDYTLEEIQDFMMTEDFEQLDELSKNTLGSYVKKAGQQRVNMAGKEKELDDTANALQRAKHGVDNDSYSALSAAQDKVSKQRNKVTDKSSARAQGIHTAIKKLTKEQVEEIEMLAAKHGLGE